MQLHDIPEATSARLQHHPSGGLQKVIKPFCTTALAAKIQLPWQIV
jgi:hypothetical protein